MKLVCDANSLLEVKKLTKINSVGLILLKLDFLSLETSNTLNINHLQSIIELVNKKGIKLGIYSERIFHEEDLVYIKMLLKNELFKHVDYFFYSDMGLYQILVEMGYSTKCVFYAPTYTTNSQDILVLQKLNSYVVVSCQITFDEVKQIIQNCDSRLIVEALGVACCFYSRRPLVSNYLKFKNYKLNNYQGKILKIKEETRDNYYYLVEDENGTRVYDESYFALTTELDEIKDIPYIMISHFNICSKDYLQIIELYNNYLINNISTEELKELLSKIIPNYSLGAYDNKTVLLKQEVAHE